MKKNNNELVSIIIPTYKRSNMLPRAIESCLNQTYKNIEIIVVDDNDDNSNYRKTTALLMEKYKYNNNVIYIQMPKNGGGAAARNYGIDNASGEYIAFLDDDDIFFDNKIEKQIKFMKKNKLDACFTGSETYDETKDVIIKEKKYKNFNKYDDILKFHLVEMIVSTQTFMIKKDVLLTVNGFSVVPAGQEYYLMYKIILEGYKIGYLDEILTRIFIHSGERITTSKNKIYAEKFLYNLKKKHFDILNYSQKRKIKYIYKYNIWQKYKSSHSIKQYMWLLFILISHPVLILNKKIERVH